MRGFGHVQTKHAPTHPSGAQTSSNLEPETSTTLFWKYPNIPNYAAQLWLQDWMWTPAIVQKNTNEALSSSVVQFCLFFCQRVCRPLLNLLTNDFGVSHFQKPSIHSGYGHPKKKLRFSDGREQLGQDGIYRSTTDLRFLQKWGWLWFLTCEKNCCTGEKYHHLPSVSWLIKFSSE